MNIIAILLIIGLIYISIKQKNESSRNMMLLMTGLLFFCMMTKIEGYCTIPSEYLTEAAVADIPEGDSGLATDPSAAAARGATLQSELEAANINTLLSPCPRIGSFTFERRMKEDILNVCTSADDTRADPLDEDSFHCLFDESDMGSLQTSTSSEDVEKKKCRESGLGGGACGVGRHNPDGGYDSGNLQIYKKRKGREDYEYWTSGEGDIDDPAFLDACCTVPSDIQCSARSFEGEDGALGCEDPDEGSEMNQIIFDMRADSESSNFMTRCVAPEGVREFAAGNKDTIEQLNDPNVPLPEEGGLFEDDETPKEWCASLDYGKLPASLEGECPQPCEVTLQDEFEVAYFEWPIA